MSIAVSAVVKPSKLLQRSLCIGCFVIFCIAAIIGTGTIGALSFRFRWALASTFVFSGILAFLYVFLNRKTFHIDISGIGQIRLKEDIDIGDIKRQQEKQKSGNSIYPVRMMENSTIWPYLLLLRLRAENQRIRTLVILPDCMDNQTFRALQIACRWIAAHNVHNADAEK